MTWLQRYRRDTIRRALRLPGPLFVLDAEEIQADLEKV